MTTVAKLDVEIGAKDKTAKGVGSAEKRLTGLGKNASQALGGKSGGVGNIARTFAEVEQAAAKAFGNKSIIGSLGGRVGGFRAIGSALGSGLGRTTTSLNQVETAGAGVTTKLGATAATMAETAAAGEATAAGVGEAAVAVGGLGAALGPVGIALAGTVAVLGASAYAAYKFAAGWAFGGAELGRMSARLGIATDAIQKYQQAGERLGISKDATNGALAGGAQTIHDAYYARNPEARVLLRKLGVDFKKKADGTLDYEAMMPAIARGIEAQRDPVTQADVANKLGMGAMLPLLRKGSAGVQAELDDVGKHGAVATRADIDAAGQFQYNSVALGQLADRQKVGLQTAATQKAIPILGSALDAGRTLTEAAEDPAKRAALVASGETHAQALGTKFMAMLSPAADKLSTAGNKLIIAADTLISGVMLPGQSAITSRYGPRKRPRKPDGTLGSGFHEGVDFRAADGTPIGAAADGVVMFAGSRRGAGNMVKIDNGGGRTSSYLHLRRALVKAGDHVTRGEEIALSGHSGGVDPHLDYRETLNGKPVDPLGPQGQLITLQVYGLPVGTKVSAQSRRGAVAVSHAMAAPH